jgi:hypothetical protein
VLIRLRSTLGIMPLAAAVVLGGLHLGSETVTAEVLLGGTAPRGFFGWEILGGYERALPTRPVGTLPITFPVRIEGHFATRENVTNLVLSTYLLVNLVVPGFKDVDFGPYVATGPGVHLQGAWSDLREYGDVVVKSEAVTKWHILLGATLIDGERADLFVEGRYTKPSPHDFDYIAFGVRIGSSPAASSSTGGED